MLKLRIVRYSSLQEVEEHIVFAATDANGEAMEDEFVRRLLTLSARIEKGDVNDATKVSELLEKKQSDLSELLESRNADLITEEIVKIENWAEDNRKALQQQLNDLDKAIDEKNDEFMRERNVRKKLEIQREKDALNERRDSAWRDYDQQRRELKQKKNEFIAELRNLADAHSEVLDEFTINWKIK